MNHKEYFNSRKYVDYFEDLYSQFGHSVESLGWNDKSQIQRFEVLSSIGDLNGKSILDVGCGFGDFYAYLQKAGISPSEYTGYDLMQKFISWAKVLHPKGTFYCGDFLSAYISSPFDYVFASGLFFMKLDNWEAHMLNMITKMFEISEIGVGVNFLSIHNPHKDKAYQYSNPIEILKILMEKVTTRITLRHDYRQNDFTLFLYRW